MRRHRHDRGLIAIAVLKLVKSFVLLLAAAGAIASMRHGPAALLRSFLHAVNVDPHHRMFDLAFQKLAGVSPKELALVSLGTFVYAGVFALEGFALLTEKVWAEWLTVGVTTSFLPLEIYELTRKMDVSRVAALVVNVAVVVYLLVKIRQKNHEKNEPSPSARTARSSPLPAAGLPPSGPSPAV